MKCVWIRPLVLAPQMKKVPNSTQKTLVRAASRRMTRGDRRSAEKPPVIAGAGTTPWSP